MRARSVSSSRVTVPVAVQRGVAVARHFQGRLGAHVQDVAGGQLGVQLQPRLLGQEVGVAGLAQGQLDVVEVVAAQLEIRRGGVAEDRELGLDRRDEPARALDAGAAAQARRRADRVVQLDQPGRRGPLSPGSGGQAGPGVTACVACTSSWKRAASSGVASSEQTAGQARVQARSSGTPSCAAPVAAR